MLANRAPRWLLPWLVAAAYPLLAQPLHVLDHVPETYLGADTCEACHTEQFASQSASGHARSLAHVADHRLAASFVPGASLARLGGTKYSYRIDGTDLHVEVATGRERLGLRLRWAFGAGEQAVTFVGQVDEDRYVEHHFSYYASTDSLATTPGHRDVPALGAEDALGCSTKPSAPSPPSCAASSATRPGR